MTVAKAPILNTEQANMELSIRQHPKRARMSGMGEIVSRRLLDPPLILQVGFPSSVNLSSYQHRLVCSVSIWVTDAQKKAEDLDASTILLPLQGWQTQSARSSNCLAVLMGSTKISPSVLRDLDGNLKVFFIFTDLSIRIQGDFQIRCDLFDMISGRNDSVTSQVLTVYPPQSYPGVLPSTALSQCLYAQGIHLRTGNHSKKTKPMAEKLDS